MGILYLVTGATGHLGNTIIQKLISKGERVRALVLPEDRLLEALPSGPDICFGDVSDIGTLGSFFEAGGDDLIVIHCAAIVTITTGQRQRTYSINVGGTKNVVDLCVKNKVKKLIYVSSVHALPLLPKGETMTEVGEFSPLGVRGIYAKTKAEASAYVMKAASEGLNVSIVHPSGIIGPYDNGRSPMTDLLLSLDAEKLPACVTGGYDFVDVRDVADGILSCCENGRSGECYILSGGYIPVPEIIRTMSEALGAKIPVTIPIWLAKAAAPFAEFFSKLSKKTALFTSYSLFTLSSNSLFSYKKAEKELGFKPRPFRDSVADTVSWLRSQKRLKASNF
ncbi:MAG: NAD-dependent epimerase/dehydratase family protein [Oscillospiraceae bacterium]|nr:NAD-dependent epimerase/dehydratase family protein [Oscillospiraceae bacterium]